MKIKQYLMIICLIILLISGSVLSYLLIGDVDLKSSSSKQYFEYEGDLMINYSWGGGYSPLLFYELLISGNKITISYQYLNEEVNVINRILPQQTLNDLIEKFLEIDFFNLSYEDNFVYDAGRTTIEFCYNNMTRTISYIATENKDIKELRKVLRDLIIDYTLDFTENDSYDFLKDNYSSIDFHIGAYYELIDGDDAGVEFNPIWQSNFANNDSLKSILNYAVSLGGLYRGPTLYTQGFYKIPFSYKNLTIDKIYENGTISFFYDDFQVKLDNGSKWNMSYSRIEYHNSTYSNSTLKITTTITITNNGLKSKELLANMLYYS